MSEGRKSELRIRCVMCGLTRPVAKLKQRHPVRLSNLYMCGRSNIQWEAIEEQEKIYDMAHVWIDWLLQAIIQLLQDYPIMTNSPNDYATKKVIKESCERIISMVGLPSNRALTVPVVVQSGGNRIVRVPTVFERQLRKRARVEREHIVGVTVVQE